MTPAFDQIDDMPIGSPEAPSQALSTLWQRPGFLIRRLHQIHVALFVEECAGENVTPVQFSVMTALERINVVEQTTLGHVVGLDRTNTADVLRRLQQRGLVRRRVSPKDKRCKLVSLTDVGRATITRVSAAVERAHQRTIEALPEEERRRFLNALMILVETNIDIGRAPLRLA